MSQLKEITEDIRRKINKRGVPVIAKGTLIECTRSIYYDRVKKEYLMQDSDGEWFAVTEAMLRRHLKVRGMLVKPKEGENYSEFDQFVVGVQDQRGVVYSGSLAGYGKGLRTVNGSRILITRAPDLISPVEGDWCTIKALLEGMFAGDQYHQLNFLFGWMKSALLSLNSKTRKPGQLLVIAGPAECGKSLLQTIITWMLGGRESKPYAYMTGSTDFNSELFATEHLRLDDEQASTDSRARRAFGARIKELLFGHAQRMHGKHREALTLDPIWRMTISLNEEPESLQVLPPIDESLEDKLIIMRARKRPMPMPTGSTEQAEAFIAKLRKDLPGFIHWLLNVFVIPEDIRNERTGIAHWHHPELVGAIREMSHEARLMSLIDMEVFNSKGTIPFWEGTAEELEHNLISASSTVRSEAVKLLSWTNACGTYLGRLARDLPHRVEKVRTHSSRVWRIHPPPEEKD
jgi:hypothetical protein